MCRKAERENAPKTGPDRIETFPLCGPALYRTEGRTPEQAGLSSLAGQAAGRVGQFRTLPQMRSSRSGVMRIGAYFSL